MSVNKVDKTDGSLIPIAGYAAQEKVDAVTDGDMRAVTSNAVYDAIPLMGMKSKPSPSGVTSMNEFIEPGVWDVVQLSDMPGTGHYGIVLVLKASGSNWVWQLFTNTSDCELYLRNAINYTTTPPTNWTAWKKVTLT